MEEAKLSSSRIRKRMVPLEDNPLMLPIKDPVPDVVGRDIDDIPRVLKAIQDDWKQPGMNRMSAFTLGRRLRQRLLRKRQGRCAAARGRPGDRMRGELVAGRAVRQRPLGDDAKTRREDVLEQQDPRSVRTGVSCACARQPADGGRVGLGRYHRHHRVALWRAFAPLATSNLMQSNTDNIFVVASEWDTQVGKQIRKISGENGGMFDSRVFSTMVGVRPRRAVLSVAPRNRCSPSCFSTRANWWWRRQSFDPSRVASIPTKTSARWNDATWKPSPRSPRLRRGLGG